MMNRTKVIAFNINLRRYKKEAEQELCARGIYSAGEFDSK
jgi:hypothetical protein